MGEYLQKTRDTITGWELEVVDEDGLVNMVLKQGLEWLANEIVYEILHKTISEAWKDKIVFTPYAVHIPESLYNRLMDAGMQYELNRGLTPKEAKKLLETRYIFRKIRSISGKIAVNVSALYTPSKELPCEVEEAGLEL